MLLPTDDARLFFKLYWALLSFVNERLQVLTAKPSAPEDMGDLPPEELLRIRNALLDDIDLIDAFVDRNPFGFTEEELDIVIGWRHFVAGSFFIYRELKKYTVFLDDGDRPIAYGVVALTMPFEALVGPYLPVMTKTVLLPFKERIIYDGLLSGPGVTLSFGPGIRRMLKESYNTAKSQHGIVTSLPLVEALEPEIAARRSTKKKRR